MSFVISVIWEQLVAPMHEADTRHELSDSRRPDKPTLSTCCHIIITYIVFFLSAIFFQQHIDMYIYSRKQSISFEKQLQIRKSTKIVRDFRMYSTYRYKRDILFKKYYIVWSKKLESKRRVHDYWRITRWGPQVKCFRSVMLMRLIDDLTAKGRDVAI